MSKYNFDILANRKNTNSVKYDAHNSSLPMWVADMDFLLAPKIKEAISKDLEVGAIGYSLIPDAFFDAFVNFYQDRYQVSFKREELVYVSGVVASIDVMIKMFTEEGDNVVMLSPIYHTFYHCINNYNRRPLVSELIYEDGQYSIDWDDLEEKFKLDCSKIFILCNPHNPVGRIFTEEELSKIDELAIKHQVLVISDEIHGWITNPGIKYVPYHKVAKGEHVICMSTSKAFNLAGLQSAVTLCSNEGMRKRLQEAFNKDDIGEPNYFAVNANIAALNDSGDWLDEMNEYVYNNKRFFKEYVESNIPNVKVLLTDATYMVWVDVSYYTQASDDFCREMDKLTGLLVSPGTQFGRGGEGFFRINLATSLENVKEAGMRLKKFICAYLEKNKK